MTKNYFALLFLLSAFIPTLNHAEPTGRPITIRAVEGLQFDPPRAKMNPGQTVLIRFLNRDPNDQPHNLILIKPGSLQKIQQASLQVTTESIARDYVPEHDAVLKSTKLLTADQTEEFEFTAPKEEGVYHYICTFPGHAMMMYGALYVGEKYGNIEHDMNIPQVARDRAKRISAAKAEVVRPKVRRCFMKDVGPAAIAVALTNDLNYCWDAGNCRLRYAWSGEFIDTGDNARSNGNRQFGINGETFWNGAGDESTYAIRLDDPNTKPDFKGYRLIDGQPEFRYTLGELEVTEWITSTPKGLVSRFQIANATAPVKLYAKGNITSTVGVRAGDYIIVEATDAAEFSLSIASK